MVQKRVWMTKSHKMRVCKLCPILCSAHISRATFSVDHPLIRNVPHFKYTLIGQEATVHLDQALRENANSDLFMILEQ